MPRFPVLSRPRPGRLLLLAGLLALVGLLALAVAACGDAAPELTAPAGISSSSSAASSASSASSAPGTSAEPVLAPELTVTLFDGTVFNLAEHLSRDGRPVLLHLWGVECPTCREQMPYLDEASRRHPEVLFLGVSVQDDPATAAACAADEGFSYPLGADPDGTVAAAFTCPELPAIFLIGSDGTLLGAVYGSLSPDDIESLVTDYLAG